MLKSLNKQLCLAYKTLIQSHPKGLFGQQNTYIQDISPLDYIPEPDYCFNVNNLKINVATNKKKKPEFNPQLKFGAISTDHLLEINWTQQKGWEEPQINPYQPFQIDPLNSSLHYAIQCFEGMKAFKDAHGKLRLFRPHLNMNRFRRSCMRISLPDFQGDQLLKCIKEFCKIERDWIPDKFGYSLYLRPTAISMTNQLGVRAPQSSKLFVVASPVGPYYPSGFKPVSLYCETRHIRSAPKGYGAYKLGSNYGPTITVSKTAELKGYAQILWIYNNYITEVGTSNFFFFWRNEEGEDELCTHPADDLILHGVTRDSVLKLTRSWNKFKVTERATTIQELIKAIKENRLYEAFSVGTAVTVGPVSSFCYNYHDYKIPLIPELNAGKLTKQISDSIMGIQYGQQEHEWSELVD